MAYAGGQTDVVGGSVNDGEWHHLVGTTINGGLMAMWIDGVRISFAGPATIDSSVDHPGGVDNSGDSDLFIGANPESTSGREWEGGIDEVAQWNRVLSDSEILSLYEAGRRGMSLAGIPEPDTALLVGLGAILAVVLRRDRKE